ncbi:MAG: site-specific integrase, partial [Oxalobacter sp.]|nr:site-specific integrase [Oxalobacter sp.]
MAKKKQLTFAKPENQVKRLMQHDQSKSRDDPTKLSSIGTRRNYEDRLVQFGRWLKAERRGTAIVDATADDVQSWLLAEQAKGLSQKTLDMDRHAGNFLLHETGKLEAAEKLAKVQAVAQSIKEPRAYTQEEVDAILSRMEGRNALGVEICFSSGLRAHELLTLQRLTPESRQPDVRYYDKEKTQPKNSPLKFTDTKGQSHGVAYTVEGKGGLIREV